MKGRAKQAHPPYPLSIRRASSFAGTLCCKIALLKKIRPMQVLLGNLGYRHRPTDSERGIIEANAAGISRVIWRGNQIINLDLVSKCLKSVSEPLRDIELVAISA